MAKHDSAILPKESAERQTASNPRCSLVAKAATKDVASVYALAKPRPEGLSADEAVGPFAACPNVLVKDRRSRVDAAVARPLTPLVVLLAVLAASSF